MDHKKLTFSKVESLASQYISALRREPTIIKIFTTGIAWLSSLTLLKDLGIMEGFLPHKLMNYIMCRRDICQRVNLWKISGVDCCRRMKRWNFRLKSYRKGKCRSYNCRRNSRGLRNATLKNKIFKKKVACSVMARAKTKSRSNRIDQSPRKANLVGKPWQVLDQRISYQGQ